MENSRGLFAGGSLPKPEGRVSSHPRNPFQFTFQSYSDNISSSSTVDSGMTKKSAEKRPQVHHYRASSDGYLLDIEQPSWLDELLNEPDSPIYKTYHRRSSSDSAALLNSVSSFTTDSIAGEISDSNSSGGHSKAWRAQERSLNIRSDSATASTASSSKIDSKKARQQFARNSRLRKLQYIADLERSVQFLQAKGIETTAALQYHNEEILILGMENQALKQRIDNLSQEQLIKYMEQDMLEREIARLQILYHQQQQQQQEEEQKQMNPINYLNHSRSREIKLQLANLCI